MNAAENSTVYTTDTTADYEHYTHSGRHYSPQAEALLKGLIQGGKHAKNAITTLAGIAKLDVENAEKVYKALSVTGFTLPSIVLLMINAPASLLLTSVTGVVVGLLGNKGVNECLKVKNARRRDQEALELIEQYTGRIQFLENDLEHSKMKIKSKFEAFQFLYTQQIEALQDEISSQQALILEQSTTLNQNAAEKRTLEKNLKQQFGAEVEKIITEANQKIETGNHETRKALSLRDDMANRLQHADRLCRQQAQAITQLQQDKKALKSGLGIDQKYQAIKSENTHIIEALDKSKIEISTIIEEAEISQKRLQSEIKDLRRIANLKEEIINDMSKLSDDSRLSAENKALRAELKDERAEFKRLNSEVLSSKNETINAQQQQIRTLEFSLKYATLNEKPDTGDIEGKADSKRYTAIIEGVKIGAITRISQKDLSQFRYAGKSISPRIVTRYQQALVRDGYAEKGAGGFKLVVTK